MKSCPRCQREYAAEINFCLDDGEMLISAPLRQTGTDRELTLVNAVRQTSTFLPPSSYSPPAVWQPTTFVHQFVRPPSRTLATTSLVLALVSITVGWCCLAGVVLGPAAIITGAMAVSKISKDPTTYVGRNAAIAGIIIGTINLVLYLFVAAVLG